MASSTAGYRFNSWWNWNKCHLEMWPLQQLDTDYILGGIGTSAILICGLFNSWVHTELFLHHAAYLYPSRMESLIIFKNSAMFVRISHAALYYSWPVIDKFLVIVLSSYNCHRLLHVIRRQSLTITRSLFTALGWSYKFCTMVTHLSYNWSYRNRSSQYVCDCYQFGGW